MTAIHVIEHVSDVIRTMEEFHRLVREGGTVRIETPHYTDFSSFCDPTHKSHLNSFSFRYFGENHGGFGYYSKAQISRGFGAGEATCVLAVAGFRVPGEPVSQVPAVLGVLSVLRGAGQGDGVRISDDPVRISAGLAHYYTEVRDARTALSRVGRDSPPVLARRSRAPLAKTWRTGICGGAGVRSWRAITGRDRARARSTWWPGTAPTLVFVEVKTRKTTEYGRPERAVDAEKRLRIQIAARDYARRAGVDWESTRFDIVSVTMRAEPQIEWLQRCFTRCAARQHSGRGRKV